MQTLLHFHLTENKSNLLVYQILDVLVVLEGFGPQEILESREGILVLKLLSVAHSIYKYITSV